MENYFCNSKFIDTEAQRKSDRMIFPVSKMMMNDRVESLAKSNPYSDEYFLMIEDNNNTPVCNINIHSIQNQLVYIKKLGYKVEGNLRRRHYASGK